MSKVGVDTRHAAPTLADAVIFLASNTSPGMSDAKTENPREMRVISNRCGELHRLRFETTWGGFGIRNQVKHLPSSSAAALQNF